MRPTTLNLAVRESHWPAMSLPNYNCAEVAVDSIRLCLAIFCSLIVATASKTWAQASIAAENIVDTVTFSYIDATGTKQLADVTLVRDEREEDQWYYVPSSPNLSTVQEGSKAVPQFSLVRYDYRDTANSATILRAGLLNFSARLSFPPEALPALKTAAQKGVEIRKGKPVADRMRIAALPINSATVSVYSSDNKLVGTAEGTGTAPTFASQSMAFSIPLTQLGVAVFDDLIKSPAGVRVAVQFSYNGLTPKCGYKVTADYQAARDFYSKNEKFAARASYYGLFGGSVSSETTYIRDQLVQSGVLKPEITASNECKAERLDSLMQPVLKRINDQILEVMKPPAEIVPAQAGTPSTGGYFGGVGYSVAVKKVSQLKRLTETIEFNQQTIVERNTVAQGFVGIGKYSDDIKSKLVLTVDGTVNPGTYLAFPQVPRGVDRVDLSVSLLARGQHFATGQFQYLRAQNAWTDLQTGKNADRISFSLAGIEQAFGKAGVKDAELRIAKVLTTEQDATSVTSAGPVTEGASTVDLNKELSGVRLIPSALVFTQSGGNLKRVTVSAKSAEKLRSYNFEAVNVNGTWQSPGNEYFFSPDKGQVVELTVRGVFSDPAKNVTHQLTVVGNGLADVFLDEVVAQK